MSGPTWRQGGIGLLVSLGAILAGLAAVTGDALAVALVAGLLVALVLVAIPRHAVTLVLLLGLTLEVALSHIGPSASKFSWVVSLLGFLLMIPAILNANRLRGAPAFVHVALLFVLYSLLCTLLQLYSGTELIAGIKRQFQMFGLLLALALIPFDDNDHILWRRLIAAIAVLQLPFSIYEHFVLAPKIGGLRASASSLDVVAGTFGANLESGSLNSVMVLFVLIILAFALARWRENLLSGRHLTLWLVLCLGPVALGEVKVAFVMIPIMVFIVFKTGILKRPGIFLAAMTLGALIFAALGYVLIEFIIRKPLEEVIYDTLSYNVYEKGYSASQLLNRTTVLTFWFRQQGLHDPTGFLFGNGVGSSFSAISTYVVGHIAARWPTLGINLTSASTLLWDTGMVGFALYMTTLALAWNACRQIINAARDKELVADASALQVAVAFFAMFVFYNNTLVSHYSMQTIYSAALGYIAILWKKTCGTAQ